jgi:hypothetical protein
MHTLSIGVRNWCAPWTCGSVHASVPYAHVQHAHQFSYFSVFHFVYPQHARKEMMLALSMRVRKWCVYWACASGTDAYAEYTSQELMRALSICYASGTNTCTECIPSTNAKHTQQELIRTLSIRVRNWCVPWASVSVSYTYGQHKHKNSKFEEVPSKHAEQARKKLMRAPSVRVRNWCVHWAYASVQAQRAHQKSNDA